MCHLYSGPGTHVGQSCRCPQSLPAGIAQCPIYVVALHDPDRLESIFHSAGFHDIRVERATREGSFESFSDYWEPIEAGTGSMPQAYLRLAGEDRRAVREEVRSRLSRFESNGRLRMSVEMLIGSGIV